MSNIRIEKNSRIGWIVLNRPDQMNAINEKLPLELEAAVHELEADPAIHVIGLRGAGRGFCAGYDLKIFAEPPGRGIPGSQAMPWDPTVDFKLMHRFTRCFMSLFECTKPTVAVVHGFAVAGGSDIALCCDLVLIGERAKIGYPPARVWGVPTTMAWPLHGGSQRAKRLLFTGDVISGMEARDMGFALEAYPEEVLFAKAGVLLAKIAAMPQNQLMMIKQCINHFVASPALRSTQAMATYFDGVARHSPEGIEFKKSVEEFGVKKAILLRDRQKSKI